MQNLLRIPSRKVTKQLLRVNRGEDLSLPAYDLIAIVLLDLPAKLNAMEHVTRGILEGIKRMDRCMKAGLARNDWPVMHKPFANGWDRPAVSKRVASEVIG